MRRYKKHEMLHSFGANPLTGHRVHVKSGSMKTSIFVVLTLVCTAFSLVADAQSMAPNPASEFCQQKGGVTTIVTDQGRNQIGMCSFGRGKIEEWTFHKQLNGAPQIAVTTFLSHPAGSPIGGGFNPASVYCNQVGGETIIIETSSGQSAMCEFSDYSHIEEWTLFRGPSDTLNQTLVNLIR